MKKTINLNSLNEKEYPSIVVECTQVNDLKNYVEAYLKHLENKDKFPKRAKKTARVLARLGELGESVDTRPRVEHDGKIYVIGETKSQVKVEGSMIVVNPDGEEYIVKPDAFIKKYKQTEDKNVFEPIAEPISFITLTEDIVFTAPWGEEMFALKGSILNITDLDNIYAIQNEAFDKTYKIIEREKNLSL